ncbi:hypothetical protein VE04_00742 [Pseudogymnoascus sp. 24MN13]|nr:hypothetical protein VE04_00742 [Pseudogymnoascus sp. 24MN13]
MADQLSKEGAHAAQVDKPTSEGIENFQKTAPNENAKSLKRKLDSRCALFVLIYIMNYLDRNNIAAARLKGLQDDLHLDNNQYATCLSILYVGYILMQVPSNMFMNKIQRPSLYISAVMIVWGLVSTLSGVVNNFAGMVLIRFFLGFIEAAFLPGALLILSKWYTRRELTTRNAILFCGNLISNAFSALIGAGVLSNMQGVLGHAAWRWLFWIEGAITMGIALSAAFILPDLPHNTRGFTKEELELAQLRMTEDVGEADTDSEDQGAFGGLLMALKDTKMYILMLTLTAYVVGLSFNAFFPTLTKTLGFGYVPTLLMSAPPWVCSCIFSLIVAWSSDRHQEKFWHIVGPICVGLVGFVISMSTLNVAARYVALFLQASSYAGFIVLYSWISSSFPRPPAKRAVAIAMVNAFSQLGNVAGSYVWNLPANGFRKSYGIVTAMFGITIVGCFIFRFVLTNLNKKLEEQERALDTEPDFVKEVMNQPDESMRMQRGFRYLTIDTDDTRGRYTIAIQQLTILEERLEKAEALLRSHFTEAQLAEMMDGAAAVRPALGSLPLYPSSSSATPSSHNNIPAPEALPSGSSEATSSSYLAGTSQLVHGIELGVEPLSGAGHSAGSYELAPSLANDFEWNESSWSAYGPAMDAGDSEAPQDIVDGMASLSVGDHRGYLGAVSGAALLRQILSALVGNLIDAFFSFYHPTFPIVHEPTFRAQYDGTLPRPDKENWNTLANILAALGSFASSNCSDATDLPIFQAAQKSLFADNLEVGNLTLVQAFGLSATYLQKRNKPNTGYNYGGVALRLGIGLGLHKEFEQGNLPPLQMEIRRRVWWTLCVLDVGATVTYGRPLNWPQAGVETALPMSIHEEDLVSDSAPYPPEADGLTLYTYLRIQSSYHLRTMGIYNRLITGSFPNAAELITLDDENIGAWLAQWPHYYVDFPPAGSKHALGVGISKWRYRNLRIVMYRPFLVRWALSSSLYDQQASSSTESLAVFRCLDAAKETILSVEEYWMSRSHFRLAAWYVLYFLFHATLVPIHCLRHNPRHPLAPDWRSQIRASLAVMDAMSELSPNSSKCREISLKLCWPHLQEEGTQFYNDDTAFLPSLADGEAASVMNGYDAWCALMSNTGEGVPLYQWPNLDDEGLNFFYGLDSGHGL